MSDITPTSSISDFWNVVNDLRSLSFKVHMAIGTGAFWDSLAPGVDSSARDAQANAVGLIDTQINRLAQDGDLGLGLQDGSFAPERWIAVANVEGQALNDIMKQSQTFALSDFWQDVVVKSASDTGKAAVAAGTAVANHLPEIGAGLVLVLLLVAVIVVFK